MRTPSRGWGHSLLALFDDLEEQALGLAHAQRDLDVADQQVSEYAEVDLADRLHGSVGQSAKFRLLGGLLLDGEITRVGSDFVMLQASGTDWLVRTAAMSVVTGLAGRGIAEPARSVLARLSVRSMLRRLSQERLETLLHFVDTTSVEGRLGRVGADFVECLPLGDPTTLVVPLTGLAAVQARR